jgi:hypothetical protein
MQQDATPKNKTLSVHCMYLYWSVDERVSKDWWCRIWGSHSSGYKEFCLLGYDDIQSIESNRWFEGTYCLHLHHQRISQMRNRHACYLPHIDFMLGLFILQPWRWWHVPLKQRVTLSGLCGIIHQKTTLNWWGRLPVLTVLLCFSLDIVQRFGECNVLHIFKACLCLFPL